MKASLLTGVSASALLLVGSAQAADMAAHPVYKAQPVAPVWSWTGFYVGGTLGGVWSRNTVGDDPTATNPFLGTFGLTGIDNNSAGVIGGLEAGYNWQLANWVLGIEADISFSSLNQSTVGAAATTDVYQSRLDWLSTVRGRVGYAFDRWLVYGTGGAAIADLKDTYTSPTFAFVAAPSATTWGWTAGGGVEYAVADHWTVKAEYLHVGFGNRTVDNLSTFGYGLVFKNQLDIARVGINYKF